MGNEKKTDKDALLEAKAAKKRENDAKKKKAKKKSIIITVCVIIAAVLVIGLVAWNAMYESGNLLRTKTAAESENYKVDGNMMAYFFSTGYQNYYSYLSYLGVDTTKSLKSQNCSLLGDEGGTWFDFFANSAKTQLKEILSLCEAAKANGMELDDDDKASIDETMKSYEDAAAEHGYSLKQFLTASVGSPVNEKDVRKCLELITLATKYSNDFTGKLSYTADELEAYYEENKDSFDGIDYISYTVSANDFMEKDADGNAVGDSAEASAKAKEVAESLAAASSEEEFKTLIAEYIESKHDHSDDEDYDAAADAAAVEAQVEGYYKEHVLSSSLPEEVSAANAGDIVMPVKDGDTSFTVYCITKTAYRDETPNRNVRHILFSSNTYEDSTKADEVYAEWESSGFSDEKFNELVNEYSDDTGSKENGGLYENVSKGQMVTEFNDWLFDSDRKTGDSAVVKSSYGWHIIQYLGESDGTAWETSAEAALEKADYTAMTEKYGANVTFNDKTINSIDA